MNEEASTEAPSEVQFLQLPGNLPIEVSEARQFCQRGRAKVIALAGMKECGKTSLLARIHQMFLGGPFAGVEFSAGRSLPRFEELNWLATMESRAPVPTMPRSSSQFDNSFLHIAVRPIGGGRQVDLLLNDISGETFKNAVAAQVVCEKLIALSRADHLVTMLDGDALADRKRRPAHIGQVSDFLERVIQSGQCGAHTAVNLVVSKMDKLTNSLSLVEEAEALLGKKVEGRFGSVRCWRIAARPMDDSTPTVEPIAELFESWVNTTHRYTTYRTQTQPSKQLGRDFCRYGQQNE